MAIESTLVLCKPDAVSRGLVGEIVARIERRGYIITAMRLMQVDGDRARELYAEHKGKPFYDGLVAFITSGPLVALAVEGEGAILGFRQLLGATNPAEATPGTIRADYAQMVGRNLVHGSDSLASAKRELKIFFNDSDFMSRRHDLDRWIKEQ